MFVVAVCCHFWKQYQNFDCFTNKDLLCKEFKMCRRSTRKLITTSEIVNPFSLQTWTPWLALVIIWLVLVTMWLVLFHFSHLRTCLIVFAPLRQSTYHAWNPKQLLWETMSMFVAKQWCMAWDCELATFFILCNLCQQSNQRDV